MKLRLEILIGRGTADKLEHEGPLVRLGRDPDSDLPFSGEAAGAVSWRHAEIELTPPAQATITDCGSTNGTLVNDRRISIRTPLHVGDLVQLGATGPLLKVVALERSAKQEKPATATPTRAKSSPRPESIEETMPAPRWEPEPEPTAQSAAPVAPTPPRVPWLAIAGIGVAVLAVAALVFVLLRQNQRPPQGDAQKGASAAPKVEAKETTPARESAAAKPERTPPAAVEVDSKQAAASAAGAAPDVERREVGTLAAPPRSPPSVLLQRERAPYPWSPLRGGERVATAQHLVSLPGYRSRVSVDGGLQLTLWGNVPEFSTFPVLESAVMLHAPPPGLDLDVTLERGRIHLAQQKSAGEARVRVRFQRETWDLLLPSSETEIVLELWTMLPEETPTPAGKDPLTVVGLFTKGTATLKTGQRELALKPQSQLTWIDPGTLSGPRTLSALPEWWVQKVDPKAPQIGDAMLALQDYAALLNKSDAVVDTVLTQVRESPDAPHRAVGVLFLGALDAVGHLVDALEERQYPEVRGAAIHALRHWLRRSADHEQELFRTFGEQRGYSKEKAKTIVQLLRGFSQQEAKQPQTYAMLVAYLDHENLGVRQLAFWHLAFLAPAEAKKVKYDPAAPPEERKEACAQWKKALPAGALPARS